MIGFLQGKPIITNNVSVIVNVNGVGYSVFVSSSTREALSAKQTVELYTYTNLKQDALELYGFMRQDELEVFKLLISVSGIGPKIALSILDRGVDGIVHAVSVADVGFFTSISKVGKKNAQKIIIELKNKLGSVLELDLSDEISGETNEVLQTLAGMGFSKKEALEALRKAPKNLISIEDKLRYALKELGT